MNVPTIKAGALEAGQKYREYREAVKRNKGGKAYKELKKLYYRIYQGDVIVDVKEAIKLGGLHPNGSTKLAICRASAKAVELRRLHHGKTTFISKKETSRWGSGFNYLKSADVEFEQWLPAWVRKTSTDAWEVKFQAPVPFIPPNLMPDKLTDDYYILWEVDEWKMVPPTDPWLLRRINKQMYVVVGSWNLTELEKSVMGSLIKP